MSKIVNEYEKLNIKIVALHKNERIKFLSSTNHLTRNLENIEIALKEQENKLNNYISIHIFAVRIILNCYKGIRK